MLSIIDAVPSNPFVIYTRVRSSSSSTARTTGKNILREAQPHGKGSPRLLLEAIALPPMLVPRRRRLRGSDVRNPLFPLSLLVLLAFT